MNSEKVKKIKKVLEMFAIDNKEMTLFQSPVPQGESCEITIKYADILTLINELESENKKQKQANKKVINIIYSNNEENKQLKERIDELEKEKEILQGTKDRLTFADRIKIADNARVVTLTKFAEKLKEEIPDESTFGYLGYNGVKEVIDEKLKECLGK